MSRGLLILALQLLIIAAMACLGIWTLVRPKGFQGFLHENFGLLPPVRDGLRLTPILIRFASIFFLWYSYALADAFRMEILRVGELIKRFVG
jgi:hypothetical protein